MKYWRPTYGLLFGLAAVSLVVTLMLNAPSITRTAVGKFDLGWTLWSRSEMQFGVIPYVGLWIALTMIERRYPAGTLQPRAVWFLNLKVNLLTLILAPFQSVLIGVLLGNISTRVGVGLIDLRLTHGASIGKAVTAFVIWFFTIDFFYYWWHRFQHESFLWHQHKVHHLDEHVSSVTALRVHWLENLLYVPMVAAPTALLFKFDPSTGGIALGVISVFTAFWQTFFHANLKIGFGWASPLFVSPQLHRIHHSRLPEHHDKNYAGYFPILDVLFGTYYHPRRDEYPATGVHDEKDVESFKESLFLPLRDWWRMFRDWCQRRTVRSA